MHRLSILGTVSLLRDTSSWHFATLKSRNFIFAVVHLLEFLSASEGAVAFRHELCCRKLTATSYRSRLVFWMPIVPHVLDFCTFFFLLFYLVLNSFLVLSTTTSFATFIKIGITSFTDAKILDTQKSNVMQHCV